MTHYVAGGTIIIFADNLEIFQTVFGSFISDRSRGGAVYFVMLFEETVFALEGAFGGGFVAQGEIVLFGLLRGPVVGRGILEGKEERIVIALEAEAVPFGLGGFEDEIAFEGVFNGIVGIEPTVQEDLPGFSGFAGEDEGFGVGTVFERVLRGDGAAFRGGGSGVATIAFFGFLVHVIPELSVKAGQARFFKKRG